MRRCWRTGRVHHTCAARKGADLAATQLSFEKSLMDRHSIRGKMDTQKQLNVPLHSVAAIECGDGKAVGEVYAPQEMEITEVNEVRGVLWKTGHVFLTHFPQCRAAL